jgi:uncharacterized membrane protein
MTTSKIFGITNICLGAIWFTFDIVSRTILFPSDANLSLGTVFGLMLSTGCVALGIYLIRNGQDRKLRILSVVCFSLFLLDVRANVYIISIR